MSQFFGLNTAYTGLLAANAALNTTANNMSNVHTEGYSRQVVNLQAQNAMRTFTEYGSAGAGVDVISIERMRNEFYDVKYWNNNADSGEYDLKSSYMKQVENYFKNDDTIDGFTNIFNKMDNALNGLALDAEDSVTKGVFVGTANNLADYFNGLAGNLEKLQGDANDEIKITTDAINSLASQIATINQQINLMELRGETASTLRDQRTVCIDKLSKLVDTEVIETPIVDPGTGLNTGTTRYEVKIAGGQSLVDTNDYNVIVCRARETDEKVNQSDVDGLYDLYWGKSGSEFNIETASPVNSYGGNLGGALKGLMQMRDGNNGENFQGVVSGVSPDSVTIDVDADYLQGISKVTLPEGGGKIKLDNQEFYYDSWECKYDETTDSYSYVFNLSDSSKNPEQISYNKINKDAEVGTSVNYQGIPYYMQQMNEWVRSYASAFNEIISEGVDEYGEMADELFVANDLVNGGQLTLDDDVSTGFSANSNSYYRLTAKNFAVSNIMIKDPGKFPSHTDIGAGASKYDIIDSLLDLKDNKEKMSFRGASAGEFLDCIYSDVLLNASTANLFNKNHGNISGTIENQRLSVSGVDEDQEAINLVRFQNSYTLSSKMIQTLTEVYDQLILRTGV